MEKHATGDIEIGRRVERIRNGMGLPKTKFAELIGISGQALGSIERGENGMTSSTLVSLCEKTGNSSDYILFGERFRSSKNKPLSVLLSKMDSDNLRIAVETLNEIDSFLNK